MSSIFFAVKTFQEFESETPRETPFSSNGPECLKFIGRSRLSNRLLVQVQTC